MFVNKNVRYQQCRNTSLNAIVLQQRLCVCEVDGVTAAIAMMDEAYYICILNGNFLVEMLLIIL